MAEQIYKDSVYRFSDPVRFFKANDPYYFEVDNMPLKQLQENCLWLKDQLNSNLDGITDVRRGDIQELKPYVNGVDRVVRVKPGRFTARINDVANKQPLQFIRNLWGGQMESGVGQHDIWGFPTNNPGEFPDPEPAHQPENFNTLLMTALDKFKSTLSQDALAMTGLSERAFTFPVMSPSQPIWHQNYWSMWGVELGVGFPDGQQTYMGGGENVPNEVYIDPAIASEYSLWAKVTGAATQWNFNIEPNEDHGALMSELPLLETQFMKAWRGVTRLSIVDVPQELNITVPPFSTDDFNYIDENGDEVEVEGIQSRIDLVFIYSKPVDASAVSINRGTTISTITEATLGIVRGAGIKMSYQEYPAANEALKPDKWSLVDGDNNQQILASPADQANDNLGFTAASGSDIEYDIRGSFPSPDDLLNIAPLISERLEDNAFELIGQSILPVAYIWVRSAGTETGEGAVILGNSDVVDIRPLFRTAELSYNERAGIAAAMPQISIANPVTSKYELEHEVNRLYDYTTDRFDNLVDENFFIPSENITTLATGYVMGGWNFGPEGALYDYWQQENPSNQTEQQIRNQVRDVYGYAMGEATIIPNLPQWDVAQWITNTSNDITNGSLYPNDYITTYISQSTQSAGAGANTAIPNDSSVIAGSLRSYIGAERIRNQGSAGVGKSSNFGDAWKNISNYSFQYVSKNIPFTSRPDWLYDYSVDVRFVNCINQTTYGFQIVGEHDNSLTIPAGTAGWWVEKQKFGFTIYVAMISAAPNGNYTSTAAIPRFPAPHYINADSNTKISDRGGSQCRFASFLVPVEDILNENPSPIINYSSAYAQGYHGNPRMGKCTLPTVMWTITGIPNTQSDFHYTHLGINESIELRGA